MITYNQIVARMARAMTGLRDTIARGLAVVLLVITVLVAIASLFDPVEAGLRDAGYSRIQILERDGDCALISARSPQGDDVETWLCLDNGEPNDDV